MRLGVPFISGICDSYMTVPLNRSWVAANREMAAEICFLILTPGNRGVLKARNGLNTPMFLILGEKHCFVAKPVYVQV